MKEGRSAYQENIQERNPQGGLDVDGKKILEWTIRK